MFKVLLVDDELLIRTNLKSLIPWEEHGYSLVEDAANAKEALEIIKKKDPNIVILDMKMPDMSGYELSSILHKDYPNIKMIILSNYDDFDFVKGTLKNGAVDYILKHTLNQNTLLSALETAKKGIPHDINSISPPKTSANINALREKLIQQLVQRQYSSDRELYHQLDFLEIPLGKLPFLPIVMEIDNACSIQKENDFQEHSLLEFSIVNIGNDLLEDYKNGILTFDHEKRFTLLLSFGGTTSEDSILYKTNQILNTLLSTYNKLLSITVSFSIGKLCHEFSKIPVSYQIACENLAQKLYMGKNCIIHPYIKNYPTQKTDYSGIPLKTEKELQNYLTLLNYDELIQEIENLFQDVTSKNLDLPSIQVIVFDLLNIGLKSAKKHGISQEILFDGESFPKLISTIETIAEYKDLILSLYQNLFYHIKKHSNTCSNPYINATLDYIYQNYQSDLSLAVVADHINIVSSYLSRIFKAEMGIGFAEFLLNYRMEKYLDLLQHNKNQGDVKKLALTCGFNNFDYLAKNFKKRTGLTPKQYLHHSNNN